MMRASIGGAACLVLLAYAGSPAIGKPKNSPPKQSSATAKPTLPPIMLKLIVSANAEPDNGPPPLKVQFEAEVYEGESMVRPQYVWDFGDGSAKAREPKPLHTYKQPGTYTAVLTVQDADGRSGRDEIEINVEAE